MNIFAGIQQSVSEPDICNQGTATRRPRDHEKHPTLPFYCRALLHGTDQPHAGIFAAVVHCLEQVSCG